MDCRTFADGHGCYDSLDCILAFIAVLAIEIDAELIVLALARCSYAHGRRGAGGLRWWYNVEGEALGTDTRCRRCRDCVG